MNIEILEQKLPEPMIRVRMFKCKNCNADHEFSNPCASCPNGRWGPEFCEEKQKNPKQLIGRILKITPEDPTSKQKAKEFLENSFKKQQEKTGPSFSLMAKNITKAATNWALNGFAKVDEETLKTRLETCHGCEFWNAQGFKKTGRCMKCGCSTWAKLRMATEKCPIGKWGPSV